jgi:hypothetical protein
MPYSKLIQINSGGVLEIPNKYNENVQWFQKGGVYQAGEGQISRQEQTFTVVLARALTANLREHEVPGRVVFERITNYTLVSGAATIDFEWCIESQVPPSKKYKEFYSTPSFKYYDYTGGVLNSTIKKVTLRIRKITQAINTGTTLSPYDSKNYTEVGKIYLTAVQLGAYNLDKNFNNLEPHAIDNRLCYGMGLHKVSITFTGLGEPKWKLEGSTATGNITWNDPNKKYFEPNSIYYITVEPEKNPLDIKKVAGSAGFEENDGYYGLEDIRVDYSKYNNLSTLGEIPLFPASEIIRNNKANWWPSNPGAASDSFSRYRVYEINESTFDYNTFVAPLSGNNRVLTKLLNSGGSISTKWSDYDSKINYTNYLTYGLNIVSRISNATTGYYSGATDAATKLKLKDIGLTQYDINMIRSEFLAWFRIPFDKVPTLDLTNLADATTNDPNVNEEKWPKVENVAGTTTERKVTIYGLFNYSSLDFYLRNDLINQYDNAIALGFPTEAATILTKINEIDGTLRIASDRPKKCGFILINKKTGNRQEFIIRTDLDKLQFSSYVTNLPQDVRVKEGTYNNYISTITSGNYSPPDIKFQLTIPFNINLSDEYFYTIFVEKVPRIPGQAGKRFYAHPSQIEKDARQYPISLGSPNVSKFPDPSVHSKGFWYQVYNCWKLVENDPIRTQIPYMTRRTDMPEDGPTIWGMPVHYYMDMTFVENANYQFRTTLEGFVRGKTNTTQTAIPENNDAQRSNMFMVLPWSETMQIPVPYINAHIPSLSLGDRAFLNNVNVYMYSNINAYTFKNSKNIIELGKTQVDIDLTTLKAKPRKLIMSKHNPQNPITYSANSKFTQSLSYVGIAKSDWILQGFAPFNILNQTNVGKANVGKGSEIIPYFINDEPIGGKGWHWLEKDQKLVWFDKVAPSNNLPYEDALQNNPIGGNVYDFFSNKTQDFFYLLNNFIARFVIYQSFNMSFDYLNQSSFGISLYIGRKLPYKKTYYSTNIDDLINDGLLKLIGKLGRSTDGVTQKCQFYGLEGNQYIIFVADPVIGFNRKLADGTIDPITQNLMFFGGVKQPPGSGYVLSNGKSGFGTYSVITLSNFKLSSNYHEKNNVVLEVKTSDDSYSPLPPITNASYSITLGNGNNVFQDQINLTETYTAKAGNATFNSGTWENGVWNNGWREDSNVCEFYRVLEYYSYNKDRNWRVKIYGPESSTSNFSVGDQVSLGNITCIDINDKRKLLKKQYYVTDVQKNYIEIEFITDFPIKRVEKDSDEHRILATKNVWLNGVFFNGYFKGIWNNGIFSGYPKLAKMDESQWIDGTFNGGHFTAKKYTLEFAGAMIALYENIPRLSLLTTTRHRLTTDDIISVTYSYLGETKYLGTTLVLDTPSEYEIITGYAWESVFGDEIKNGNIMTVISTGLIQNFNFYSNNVSKVTSLDTMMSDSVFSYNSWIDVNYSNQTAVNIGRPQSNTESLSRRIYPENNLYGYPTSDVLSSYSVFRDSFSRSNRKYRLGSKFEIYSDYVGAPSAFEDWFDSTITDKGKAQFKSKGWDYTKQDNSRIELFAASASMTKTTLDSSPTLYDVIMLTLADGPFIGTFEVGKYIDITGPGFRFEAPNVYDAIYTDYTKIVRKTKLGNLWEIVTDDQRDDSEWSLDGTFKIGITGSSNVVYSRTPEPVTIDSKIQGKELKIVSSGNGGILDLVPAYDVPNRRNGTDLITVEANKYTMVEFDIVDYTSATNSTTIERTDGVSHPPLHFNNLNYVKREISNTEGVPQEFQLEASYLPVYKNINHLTTFGQKKQEFFFNKRNLMMNMHGVGPFGMFELDLYIDNLKFYEVDMVPFFQYFNDPFNGVGNINISIQAPKSAKSPTIVLSDEELADTETPNEIIGFFTEQLIGSNIEIPLTINWEQDYSIYRPQINDIDETNSLYGGS